MLAVISGCYPEVLRLIMDYGNTNGHLVTLLKKWNPFARPGLVEM